MRLGTWLGIPIRMHPLLLPVAAVAIWMGEGTQLMVMGASVFLHELAHIGAARAMHIKVTELEILPFGGAARMESLWISRPAELVFVALAGPALNLLIVLMASTLCWQGALDPRWAAEIIRCNLIILLFNLIPALPLDGGRALCGLLSVRMRPDGAARVGVWLGRALGVCLIGAAVYTAFSGRFNLSYAMAGVYVILSGRRELMQADGAALLSFLAREGELVSQRVMPIEWLAASERARAMDVARRMRPKRMHMIAVFDAQARPVGVVSERTLARALMENASQPVGALIEAGAAERALL